MTGWCSGIADRVNYRVELPGCDWVVMCSCDRVFGCGGDWLGKPGNVPRVMIHRGLTRGITGS